MAAPEFINSATVTVPEKLVLGKGDLAPITLGVRYGLWVHPVKGPILIDTGYGPEVYSAPGRSLALRLYAGAIGAKLIPENDPVAVLKERGYAPEDVRHILISHFHADHISRLKAFPNAQFHVNLAGYQALKRLSALRRIRHGHFLELLPRDFEVRLFAYEASPVLDLPFCLRLGFDVFGDGSVFAVDLPGHAVGHTGFFWPAETNRDALIYAADASWLLRAIVEDRAPSGPAGLVYEDKIEMRQSLATLRRAAQMGCQLVVCHDPVAGSDAKGRPVPLGEHRS
jgi:glyoxylase-like metal-dependent hydrolase (beta-lactamase superfamily II)